MGAIGVGNRRGADNGRDPGRINLLYGQWYWPQILHPPEMPMLPSLKPLADRVIVERVPPQETSSGGIVLPDRAKDKPQEGTVVAAGPGRLRQDGQLQPLEVHEGDKVLFGSYAGNEVKIDGKDYLIMKEEEILAVVSN
jgi:chaperonin GroES